MASMPHGEQTGQTAMRSRFMQPKPSIPAAPATIVIAITTPEPAVAIPVAVAEAKDDRRSAVVTASVHPITAHRTVVWPDVPMPPAAPYTRTVSTVSLLD